MNSKSYSCDFGPKGSVFLRGMHLEYRFPFRVLFWLLSYTPDWCLRLGATSMMLFQNMVRVSGAGFVTQAKADEVSNFWKSKQAAAAQNVWDSPCYVSYDIPVSFLSGQGHFISKSCVFFFVHWFGLQMPHIPFCAVTRCIRMSRKLWHKPWRTSAPMRNLWIDWRLQNRGPGSGNMTLGRSAWLLSHLKSACPSCYR